MNFSGATYLKGINLSLLYLMIQFLWCLDVFLEQLHLIVKTMFCGQQINRTHKKTIVFSKATPTKTLPANQIELLFIQPR